MGLRPATQHFYDGEKKMVQKAEKIWFDGKLVPWDEAQIHVLTHSLHYDVATFEGTL